MGAEGSSLRSGKLHLFQRQEALAPMWPGQAGSNSRLESRAPKGQGDAGSLPEARRTCFHFPRDSGQSHQGYSGRRWESSWAEGRGRRDMMKILGQVWLADWHSALILSPRSSDPGDRDLAAEPLEEGRGVVEEERSAMLIQLPAS